MTKQPVDGEKIREYLLGILPETETDLLDELSLTDNDFAAQLAAAENELVDAYVSGELTGEALTKFESRYGGSGRRREKVAFARTMHALLEQRDIARASETPVKRRSFWFFNNPWQVAAFALLMVIVLTGFLFREITQLRHQLTQAQTEQRSLQQREKELISQLSRQHSTSRETGLELARVQQRLKELQEQQTREDSNTNQRVQLLAFHLEPQRRGIGNAPPLLRLPGKVDFLVLTLDFEVNDFPAYQAVLKNPGNGEILWHSSSLKPNPNGGTVTVKLPGADIKSQMYQMELSGISPGSASELVNSYVFRIQVE